MLTESKLPKIGDTITTDWALELCRHLGLDYLIERIEANPEAYKAWVFDGCSCLPDELLGLPTGCDWKDITYKCCLPHDLGYAYGEPGNIVERKRVDVKFQSNLVNKASMAQYMASIFYSGVRIGGFEGLGRSFSWGFAHKAERQRRENA